MRSLRSRKTEAAPRRVSRLTAYPYAHRGLHGNGRIENSRAAFEAAIARWHGIELDVQASRDGDAFVFHDYELGRLTGTAGQLRLLSSEALRRIRLNGSAEIIPALPEILELVAGRVPLLIEVKSPDRDVASLCASVARALEGYAGAVGVMSFNAEVGRWFARHAPEVLRGLVVSEQGKKGPRGRIERRWSLWRARPDFLAYDIRDLPSPFAAAARRRGVPVLTWTVRSPRDEATAEAHANQIIYEMRDGR